MNNIIELETGDYCSIIEWLTHQDNSWVGCVLRVLHTEGSIVFCEEYNKILGWKPITTIRFIPGVNVAMIKLSKNPFENELPTNLPPIKS